MAIKEKKKGKQENRVVSILTKEYKYENLFLGIVAVVSGVFAMLIIQGVDGNSPLTIDATFPLIGGNQLVFGIILLVISILGLLLALFPFYKQSFSEFRKITWPTIKTWLLSSLRVVIFMAIIIGLQLLFSGVAKKVFTDIGLIG